MKSTRTGALRPGILTSTAIVISVLAGQIDEIATGYRPSDRHLFEIEVVLSHVTEP
ncbi:MULTISPECIES: hypothetical protein [unclassified Mesorhizobium]|uniref:hypothetical protein n=1 Tax=unclassified Mesorhizobium TaxID=325217 RepID=UPI0016753EF2|nr:MULTISPECIES: hypothetical protein [unclassified Mesorhizobium]